MIVALLFALCDEGRIELTFREICDKHTMRGGGGPHLRSLFLAKGFLVDGVRQDLQRA